MVAVRTDPLQNIVNVSWGGITVQLYAVTTGLDQSLVNYPTSATLSGLASGVTITAADTQTIYFPSNSAPTWTAFFYLLVGDIKTLFSQTQFGTEAGANAAAATWNASDPPNTTSQIVEIPGGTNPSYGFAASWLFKIPSSALANLPATLATLTLGDPASSVSSWNVQANWFVGTAPAVPLILPPVINSYLSFYMGGPSVPAVPPYT